MPDPSIFTVVINGYLPEPHATLLNGILFGIPIHSSKVLYAKLQVLGLLHLVVLSGINITLLASFVGIITASFSKRYSILITILTVVLFVSFVRPQAPIIRAAIMSILTYVAIIYGKRNFALYSLLLSLVIIGIMWPRWLTTISLYLSYGATLGILLLGSSASPIENKTSKVSSLLRFIRDDLRTSLSAQIFTVPIIFISFKQFSLISPLANLFVSFTIAPLMIFGFSAAILGKIHFVLGIVPAYICYGILSYILFVVNALSSLPFIFYQF